MLSHQDSFNDLHEEFKWADKDDKRKRILLMVALFILVSGTGIAVSAYTNSHSESSEVASPSTQSDIPSESTEPAATPEGNSNVAQKDSSQGGVKPVQQQAQGTGAVAPAAQPFNQTSFTATGRSVVSHYNEIVGLVTFGPSTTQEQKVAAIKRAYALDRQYFNEVINLRMLVNQADSAPSKYANLVNLAENGVSAVSVGVDEMYRWATGSTTSSIDSGNGMVAQGAASLLQFSQQL